ncbi:MAG: hypothetical protein M3Q47_14075 [Actinomycetota bacterium]|nr:hypothetical protein [Actinomycetota bacterium]
MAEVAAVLTVAALAFSRPDAAPTRSAPWEHAAGAAGRVEPMHDTDPQAAGRRTAEELVRRLTDDDSAGADELLAGVEEIRDLVFVGAGLTSIARAEGRRLPPAQRAQASTRQLRLGTVRDAGRDDPEALRMWLRRAAEEIVLIRRQQAVADRFAGRPTAAPPPAPAAG